MTAATNPYVGPFPFQPGQKLPNRQREAAEVADLVVAERLVLMHAPSGAGKTSLIQAAILPRLAAGYRIVGPVRVDKPLPVDHDGRPIEVHNRYVRSIALGLLCDHVTDLRELDSLALPEVLDRALPTAERRRGRLPLLVLDQLEEVLTLDPTDWTAKTQFFQELGEVTGRDQGLWALLAMREEYIGGLDRYRRYVPGYLNCRYRLDFLTYAEARAAIQRPAADQDVTVTSEAAEALVRKLAVTPVQSPHQGVRSESAPYVEPFRLQVVCHRMWKRMAKHADAFNTIDVADVEAYADVERAMSRYYGDAVAEVAAELGVSERAVRDWFEDELITAAGFRSQTTTGPLHDAGDERLLRRLVETFLVNNDTRGSTVWYELAHDTLIPAVRASNDAWRADHLLPWEKAALDWRRSGRQREYLLPPELLIAAPSPKRKGNIDYERDFLQASHDQAGSYFRVRRYQATSTVMSLIAVVELVVIVCLLLR